MWISCRALFGGWQLSASNDAFGFCDAAGVTKFSLSSRFSG